MRQRRTLWARVALLLALAIVAPALVAQDSVKTVWVTPTGKAYHKASCRTIKKSKVLNELTVHAAKELGYAPCKVCKP